jgi:hypothetical protein
MPVPAPSTVRGDIPAGIDAIVLKSLARERDQRYPNGHAMADDLEEVMRESKFKQRMVPRLLADLFGAGAHSSQVALSCLTPELLAAAGAAGHSNGGTGSIARAETARAPAAARRRLVAGLTALVLVAGVAVGLGWRSGRPVAAVAAPAVAPAPVPLSTPSPGGVVSPPAAAPSPAVVPVETTAAASPSAELAASPPTEKSKRAVAGKRTPRSAAQRGPNRIASGLSIDPFAEAAHRKPR